MGRVWSCEKPKLGRQPSGRKGKARSRRARTRVRREPRVVEDPWHARKLHARESGDLRTDCPRKRSSPAREGRKPYDWRERNGGVGLCRSTCEPAEQRRTYHIPSVPVCCILRCMKNIEFPAIFLQNTLYLRRISVWGGGMPDFSGLPSALESRFQRTRYPVPIDGTPNGPYIFANETVTVWSVLEYP